MNENRRGLGLILIPIGIIVFLAAFPVIWFNEGRVDLSVLAEESVAISGNEINVENEGKLVSLSGEIGADELLGDEPYLKPIPLIHLKRSVEMYAWDESGSEEDGYSYSKEWTSSPENSEQFDQPSGHFNPPMEIKGESVSLDEAHIGRFSIQPNEIIFGQVEDLPLTEGMVNGGRVSDNFLYLGNASPPSPEIGDLRISYSAYAANQFTTIFGKQQGDSVVLWRDDEGTIIYRGYALDRIGGIEALRTEYLTALWGVRFASLAMFFFGLMMALSPLRRILGYIPILGNVGNFAIGLAAFIVAFVVWAVTLVIAIILHNIVVLLIVLALVGGVGYYAWNQRQGKEKSPNDLEFSG